VSRWFLPLPALNTDIRGTGAPRFVFGRFTGYSAVMVSLGYFLFCEEFGPRELVRQAKMAADAGFERLWISDNSTRGTASRARARSCGR
jgi:hypothetical protein